MQPRTLNRSNLGVRILAGFAMLLTVVCTWSIGSLYADRFLHMGDLSGPDYALATTGGGVLPMLTSATFGVGYKDPLTSTRSSLTTLTTDISPGNCWAMEGTFGQLAVLLSQPIHLEFLTIDHPPRTILPDPSSAPRYWSAWALLDKSRKDQEGLRFLPEVQTPANSPRYGEYHPLYLGSFEYNIHGRRPTQTFVLEPKIRAAKLRVPAIVFRFEGNWGNEQYTCIYRVRVHGSPVM